MADFPITEADSFDSPIVVQSDGSVLSQASLVAMVQPIVNRTKYLYNRLGAEPYAVLTVPRGTTWYSLNGYSATAAFAHGIGVSHASMIDGDTCQVDLRWYLTGRPARLSDNPTGMQLFSYSSLSSSVICPRHDWIQPPSLIPQISGNPTIPSGLDQLAIDRNLSNALPSHAFLFEFHDRFTISNLSGATSFTYYVAANPWGGSDGGFYTPEATIRLYH